jgi:hypothetical protein
VLLAAVGAASSLRSQGADRRAPDEGLVVRTRIARPLLSLQPSAKEAIWFDNFGRSRHGQPAERDRGHPRIPWEPFRLIVGQVE